MATVRDPRWAMTLAGALVIAGCASASDDAAPSDAPAAAATEVAVAVAARPKLPIEDSTLQGLVMMTGELSDQGVMGSGCSPAEGEALPDGDWYGFIVDYGGTSMTLDVACVYGPETDQYAAFAQADDAVDTPYVVVNDVLDAHAVVLRTGTPVHLEALGWEQADPVTASAGLDPAVVGEHLAVWVRIDGGDAVAVVQPQSPGVSLR